MGHRRGNVGHCHAWICEENTKDPTQRAVFYTLDEVKDKHIGEVGTPHRDKYEAELQSFLIGEAIKKARKSQNMTQEELAQKIGVQRSQVSKIESGRNLTLSTIARVFKAMGMKASLSISGLGSITL